ncbi:MAG: hypothetical protein HXS46_05215 [Theionarchaea archaeon]|nr:hypothetical protein [Theionarchaea archaeon]
MKEAFEHGVVCEECMELTHSLLKNRGTSPETLEWYKKRREKCASCLRNFPDDWAIYEAKKQNVKDHKEALILCLSCLLDDVVELTESDASAETVTTCLNLIRRCCACMLNNIDACIQNP